MKTIIAAMLLMRFACETAPIGQVSLVEFGRSASSSYSVLQSSSSILRPPPRTREWRWEEAAPTERKAVSCSALLQWLSYEERHGGSSQELGQAADSARFSIEAIKTFQMSRRWGAHYSVVNHELPILAARWQAGQQVEIAAEASDCLGWGKRIGINRNKSEYESSSYEGPYQYDEYDRNFIRKELTFSFDKWFIKNNGDLSKYIQEVKKRNALK